MTAQEWLKREGISGFPDDAMWTSLMEAYAAHVNKELARVNKELVKAITNAMGFLSFHRPETAQSNSSRCSGQEQAAGGEW